MAVTYSIQSSNSCWNILQCLSFRGRRSSFFQLQELTCIYYDVDTVTNLSFGCIG